MLTHEIVPLPEIQMVKIRIIEEDGKTCLSEPCYPDTLRSGSEAWDDFAKGIIDRTIKSREMIAEDQEQARLDESPI